MDIHATKTSFPVYLPLMLLCLVLFDCSTLLGLIRGTSSNKIISASDSDPMQLSRGKKRSGVDDREFILIGKSSENFLTSWQIWQVKRSSHISWWIYCVQLWMLVLMLLRLLNNYHCTKLKKRSNPRENRFPIMHFQRECRYTQPPFSRNRAIPPLPAWQPNSSPLPFLTFPTSHLRRASNLFGIVQYPIFHFSWCS